MTELTGPRATLPALTRRELEVLGLAAHGLPSREIAKHLAISEATVKSHLYHVYGKLGVSNRVQAVRWFFARQSQVDL